MCAGINCRELIANVYPIIARQPFITEDITPVMYNQYVYPADSDAISASYYAWDKDGNHGGDRFNMILTARIYAGIRATDGTYVKPRNPLFIDAGAHIGSYS